MTAALEISGLGKAFATAEGRVEVLRDVSLTLAQGGAMALTGESGSGKSTLLHIVAGLEEADSGNIHVMGQSITTLDDQGRAKLRRGVIGLIFQQFNLIPSLSVSANIAFQARLANCYDAGLCEQLSHRMGLQDLATRFPEQLSGGQQQRVAIARTLAARPALVLADEPTGNLDEATGDRVLDLMLELASDTGAALLMVTHSPRLAARCDMRCHLRAGQIAEAA